MVRGPRTAAYGEVRGDKEDIVYFLGNLQRIAHASTENLCPGQVLRGLPTLPDGECQAPFEQNTQARALTHREGFLAMAAARSGDDDSQQDSQPQTPQPGGGGFKVPGKASGPCCKAPFQSTPVPNTFIKPSITLILVSAQATWGRWGTSQRGRLLWTKGKTRATFQHSVLKSPCQPRTPVQRPPT